MSLDIHRAFSLMEGCEDIIEFIARLRLRYEVSSLRLRRPSPGGFTEIKESFGSPFFVNQYLHSL
uniref:hypothetical protein n=1 Tax=Alistipes sp. TaxID=1872444 RepID=UPI0040567FD9